MVLVNYGNENFKTFEERYPNIKNIEVEVIELSPDMNNRKSVLGKDGIGITFNCGRSVCKNGGFNLDSLIYLMNNKKETSKEETIICNGYEDMGRKNKRNCTNVFKIKIEIQYKE